MPTTVPLRIREVDGIPSRTMPSELIFPNSSLSIVGGKITVSFGAGGGITGTLTPGALPLALTPSTVGDSPVTSDGADLLPGITSSVSLGNLSKKYLDVYLSGMLKFGTALSGGTLSYSSGVGPVLTDNSTGFLLTFNVQSLSTDRVVTWPNAAGTVTLGGNTFSGTGNIVRTDSPSFTTGITIGAGSAITSSGAGGALGTNAFLSTVFAPLDNPTFTTNIATPAASIGFGATAPPSGPLLAVATTISTSPRGIASMQFSTDTNGARVGFFKARGSVASPSTLVTGDTLGRLMFRGYVGATNTYVEGASIEALSSGTVADTSTGRLPSSLIFQTSTDANPSVLTTRLTIDNAGLATFGAGITSNGLNTITQGATNTGLIASTGYSLTGSDQTGAVSFAGTWNTSGTPDFMLISVTNTASNAASNLLNFKVGGSVVAQIDIAGRVRTDVLRGLTSGFKIRASDDTQIMQLSSGNTSMFTPITFNSDNANDIGASGATRPRTGYFGTSLVAPVGTFATSVTSKHLIGNSTAPTIANGAGAGTSPGTPTLTGTDMAGQITIITGTLPSVSAIAVTVTFNAAYGTAPYVVIWPANAAAATLGFLPYVGSTTTTFTVNAGTIALGAATTYAYNYVVVQ